MATYAELNSLYSDSDLQVKISTACVIKAHALLSTGGATAGQKALANEIFTSPSTITSKITKYVLAEHKDLSVAQIQGASDTAVQTAVDTALDALVGV